jgi:hypothetical protein
MGAQMLWGMSPSATWRLPVGIPQSAVERVSHCDIEPSTSLSSVEARLPEMDVKSIMAVATAKIPPPAPMLSG